MFSEWVRVEGDMMGHGSCSQALEQLNINLASPFATLNWAPFIG